MIDFLIGAFSDSSSKTESEKDEGKGWSVERGGTE